MLFFNNFKNQVYIFLIQFFRIGVITFGISTTDIKGLPVLVPDTIPRSADQYPDIIPTVVRRNILESLQRTIRGNRPPNVRE